MLLTSFITYCLNFIPACCVLCGLTTRHTHNLCTACFNYCQVYSLSTESAYSNTYALFPYQEPFIQMIKELKFNHELIYAKTFGELLSIQIKKWYKQKSLPALLIPVPLHSSRLKERGFNQSVEIARHLTSSLSIPLKLSAITRTKATLAQSGLSKAARQHNIRGAFTCKERFDGLTVAILDDVVTTGETVSELSRILLKQGASRIDVWCCARA